ncbi:MAG: mercury methylation corrinoid protein HgcA [Planctomycetia bacterium]|nr:mercury methylation corrinoid protein HgcA [Planctomycetia bacterium]
MDTNAKTAACCGKSDVSAKTTSQSPACDCHGEVDSRRHERGVETTGSVETPVAPVPRVGTVLGWADRLGTVKARWGIGRMDYRVEPGLYAVGGPTADSPVLVSANYKMSFDRLRSALPGVDAWILVLDTKGINVWCAAGKGTFGTDELVHRIEAARLPEIVSHRTVIVPQLGAPGVAAHEVRKRTGFRVVYGPVRAGDVPAFLQAGMKATPEMRRVEFPLRDRLAVVPVELVMGAKCVLLTMAALLVLSGLGPDGYAASRILARGLPSAALLLGAFVAGTVFGPLLLPWLPGRALSAKGTWIGLAMVAGLGAYMLTESPATPDWLAWSAWAILLPATTSFILMNFTGATTYTSLSGVRREMRVAVPIQAIAAVAGVLLWIVARFV